MKCNDPSRRYFSSSLANKKTRYFKIRTDKYKQEIIKQHQIYYKQLVFPRIHAMKIFLSAHMLDMQAHPDLHNVISRAAQRIRKVVISHHNE